MKKISRLFVMFLFVIITFSLAVPCSQATSQDDDATPDQLFEVISKRLNTPVDADTLADFGIITAAEQRFFNTKNCVTAVVAWRILLPLYGIFPYPAEFYPDIPPAEGCGSLYADARAAAIIAGIVTPDQRPNLRISKIELSDLVQKLDAGDYLAIAPPTPLPPEIADFTWELNNYRYRNAFLLASERLPATWVNDFKANNWQIKCKWQLDDTALDELTEKFENAGLTNYADHTIYLSYYSFHVIAHEFTHYAANRLGWKHDYLLSYYEAEAQNVADILPTYAQTKPAEYFAEFVAHWIEYPEQQSELILNAPKTSALTVLLITEYASLLPTD